jgi:hypothetical protein
MAKFARGRGVFTLPPRRAALALIAAQSVKCLDIRGNIMDVSVPWEKMQQWVACGDEGIGPRYSAPMFDFLALGAKYNVPLLRNFKTGTFKFLFQEREYYTLAEGCELIEPKDFAEKVHVISPEQLSEMANSMAVAFLVNAESSDSYSEFAPEYDPCRQSWMYLGGLFSHVQIISEVADELLLKETDPERLRFLSSYIFDQTV